MKNKIFKTTLKNQGHYECRFLPNISDLGIGVGDITGISFKAGFGHMGWTSQHISYALIDGQIKIWVYGNIIRRRLKDALSPSEVVEFWDVTKNKFLGVKTSEKQGFLKVDVSFKEDMKYQYDLNKDKKHLENLSEFIRHNKLEDVLYQELFIRAHLEWEDNYTGNPIKMYDVYCDEYGDFEDRYTVWLRNKKIKQIVG